MNRARTFMTEHDQASRRDARFFQTVKAVLWAFFGVRKGKDQEHDAAHLNPVHVVIAAVGAAALFVVTLILIVRQVVK